MKIAIMGAGALGCYFGGRIDAAGADVTYIARGTHLEALQRSGLKIESPLGDLALPEVKAAGDPRDVGPVDIVFMLVKMQDLTAALDAVDPMLGPDTAILSFQNGVDAWEAIGKATDPKRVIGGTAVIPAEIREPGIVRHNAPFAKLTFGEFDGSASERCQALAETFTSGGVECGISDDIQRQIWEKFIFLSAFSGVTALTRLSTGPIREVPESFDLFRRAMEEAFSVGSTQCPTLSDAIIAERIDFLKAAPPAMQSSMLDDLSRGKPLELDSLSGAVVRIARQQGVPVPTHDLINRALQPLKNGAPA